MTYNTFRPIHYLGSKLRLLDVIKATIDEIDPSKGKVIDLFSGSGVVARYLSQERPVLAVDIQEYSRILNSAMLLPFEPLDSFDTKQILESNAYRQIRSIFEPLIDLENKALHNIENGDYETMTQFLEIGSIYSASTVIDYEQKPVFSQQIKTTIQEIQKWISKLNFTISYYYGGVYFSFEQAVFLDACINYLDKINPNSKNIFHSTIISTASEIVNTIGNQFAQPITPRKTNGEIKPQIIKKAKTARSVCANEIFMSWLKRYNNLQQSPHKNIVIKADFKDAFKIGDKYNVVYADPPYTRYHYSRYYHVLETIALLDRPDISNSNLKKRFNLSKGVYRSDRHQSQFGIKTKAKNAFSELFQKVSSHGANLVLSYSPYKQDSAVTPRIVTIKQLTEMASNFYNDIQVISCGDFSHSKLNRVDKHLEASDEAELLIVARR